MDDIPDMYDTDDDNDEVMQMLPSVKKIINKGPLKEVDIDGEKLLVVDPATVTQMQFTIRTLQTKISSLEVTVSNLSNIIKQLNQSVRAMKQELDNKVSYE